MDYSFEQALSMAINCICPECGSGEDYLVRFVKKHDKELQFLEAVEAMGLRQKWDLLNYLWGSSYNIFKPWYVKALHSVIDETAKIEYCAEQRIYNRAKELYEYYKENFDKNAEVEQPLSEERLEYLHTSQVDDLSDTLVNLIEDGAIDPNTLEIMPEYKEAVRKKLK